MSNRYFRVLAPFLCFFSLASQSVWAAIEEIKTHVALPFGMSVNTSSVLIGALAVAAVAVVGVVLALSGRGANKINIVNSNRVSVSGSQTSE